MRKVILFLAVAVILATCPLVGAQQTALSNGPALFEPGKVLVGFERTTPGSRASQIVSAVGASELRVVGIGTHVLRVQPGKELETISKLKQYGEVRYANPNGYVHVVDAPNDPDFTKLWGMRNYGQNVNGSSGTPGADIRATSAWRVTTGSASVVVGVIDTGINYNHPDLVDNIWSNPGGVGGCPAGTHGYNAITLTCDPMDDHFHGSHVSGTIGGTGNNGVGVAGVNWTTSILGIKFLNSGGGGTWENSVIAVHWAVTVKQAGVNLRVLNNSWGGTGFFQGLQDEIALCAQNDIIFVAAAGNGSSNIDSFPFYPASYTHQVTNMVVVAATNQNDALASFSNWGPNSVDLAAPGVNVYSTTLGSGYTYLDGTSMATPHVVGSIALMLSLGPQTMAAIKATLNATVHPLSALDGKVISKGRLDVCAALLVCVASLV